MAEPQILGILRDVMPTQLVQHQTIHEVTKDLCHQSPKQLHDYLAERDLLPEFHRAG